MASDCKVPDYWKEAREYAADMVLRFDDEIIEQLSESGQASIDLNNDYLGGADYHHNNNIDRSYTLLQAAHLLKDLYHYKETDSGLWESMDDPERMIEVQAALTFGNGVYDFWMLLIGEINGKVDEILSKPGNDIYWDPRESGTGKKASRGKKRLKEIVNEWL